jgi:hypothetical protein
MVSLSRGLLRRNSIIDRSEAFGDDVEVRTELLEVVLSTREGYLQVKHFMQSYRIRTI